MFNRDYVGKCDITTIDFEGNKETSKRYLKESDLDIFVRREVLINILKKVKMKKNEFLSSIMSARNPYGFNTNAFIDPEKFGLQTNKIDDGYAVWGRKEHKRTQMYLPKDYKFANFKKSNSLLNYKVFIPKASGVGEIGEAFSKPQLSSPGECCTQTFLEMGRFDTKKEAENLMKYIQTKFFRTLVGVQKLTQDLSQKTFRFAPILDFKTNNEINWELSIREIDQHLYKMFELSDEEIEFIEGKICDIKEIK